MSSKSIQRNGLGVLAVCAFTLPFAITLTNPPGVDAQANKKGKASLQPDAGRSASKTKGPLTRAEVEDRWKKRMTEVLLNEIRLRNLAFEPEEDWVSEMGKAVPIPQIIAEMQSRIPAPPALDAVTQQGAAILIRLKTAAQSRNRDELNALVHPEYLASLGVIYDLFDPSNYRDHTLGRFAITNRKVGVPLFQLNNSGVERLHYIQFATSRGKLVVRSLETGPNAAARFLDDERQFAKAKLEPVFRALNDGDETALRNLCTPGLYESIRSLAGDHAHAVGARLTRGVQFPPAGFTNEIVISDSGKSIRPVAKVGFNTLAGRRIEFDVDFERIDNDLKIVRVRDKLNKVIAWDPDFDNYVNRRYKIPDGPKIQEPPLGWTDLIEFWPLSKIRELAFGALRANNIPKVSEYAQEFLESQPNGGEGYGLRASANHFQRKFEKLDTDIRKAIESGNAVYFLLLHHKIGNIGGQPFDPVLLAVSKGKLAYVPTKGGANEEIALAGVKVTMEKGGGINILKNKGRPFLKLDFPKESKRHDMNFAAWGTVCPMPGTTVSPDSVQIPGDVCPATGPAQPAPSGGILRGIQLGNNAPHPALIVPSTWSTNLDTVRATIELAQGSGVMGPSK